MDKQIKVKNIPTEVKIQKPENASLDDRFNPRNRIYVRAVTGLHQLLRQRIGFVGMLAFMLLPWINFHGQQQRQPDPKSKPACCSIHVLWLLVTVRVACAH